MVSLTMYLNPYGKPWSKVDEAGVQFFLQSDGQTERQIKTKLLFSLVIKTKVVQNVNRVSER